MTYSTTYLRQGSFGPKVKELQALLNQHGYTLATDGDFGPATAAAVRDYQQQNGLSADGIVGNRTLHLLRGVATAPMPPPEPGNAFNDRILPDLQYMKTVVPKRAIVLHHTASSHRPCRVIDWWAQDNWGRVATAYVIGGRPANGSDDNSLDGSIFRAFDDRYWAYHLGTKTANNALLNSQAVAIEICNWGYLKPNANGGFLTYAGAHVVPEQVTSLASPFRGWTHFHRYTEAQLNASRALILDIANRHAIEVKGKYGRGWFNLNRNALAGAPGLWSHVHFRTDKTDCWPQPELIDMLNSL